MHYWQVVHCVLSVTTVAPYMEITGSSRTFPPPTRTCIDSSLSLSLVPYMFLSRWWIRKAGFATRADRRVYKNGWEAVIGIEVHAQINSKTKLFSGMQ